MRRLWTVHFAVVAIGSIIVVVNPKDVARAVRGVDLPLLVPVLVIVMTGDDKAEMSNGHRRTLTSGTASPRPPTSPPVIPPAYRGGAHTPSTSSRPQGNVAIEVPADVS
jgi:hypothetical protein